MIKKLLIANRGEVVARIIRACKTLGIGTVAVYSEADRDALFTRQADEAICIGPANPMKSYLNIEVIIQAAQQCGADAVHPGYGFLAENSAFAHAVIEKGLIWVGPAPKVMEAVESKCYCRQIAERADVPVNPGTLEPIQNVEEVYRFAEKVGYPVFLKLDRGGGGKGIEMVKADAEVSAVLDRISRIGLAAFGSPDCYIEKVLADPRHLEVQFLGDHFGNYVCLGERECSIQRRHQKIIEESPSPVVDPQSREMIFDYSLRLARAMNYQGAGTIEGLRSEKGDYFFMEINARLQVEHPVTEFLTGVDIVKAQLQIASGEKLDLSRSEVRIEGHAIEARIYAEDPMTFQPSPGIIEKLELPPESPNLRIDHALEEGGSVPPFYDPLLAKVIAWGPTRTEAIGHLAEALHEFRIRGVKTTIPLNLSILRDEGFLAGNYHTGFIEGLLV